MVLQGSEAKQEKEKYTALTFRASNYIFTQTVTSEVIDADEPTTENRIVKTWRAVTRLPGANITKPPPLAVVILLFESNHCLWQWFYKAVRRNSKKKNILFQL